MSDATNARDEGRASTDADAVGGSATAERFGVARIIAVVVLGLIAAWFLYDGIGSLLGLPALFTELGIEAEIPWPALWLGAAQAPPIFAVTAIAARRLPAARYTLVLIAALGVIAATRLSLIAVATGTISVFTA